VVSKNFGVNTSVPGQEIDIRQKRIAEVTPQVGCLTLVNRYPAIKSSRAAGRISILTKFDDGCPL
jgi:hypothetical protein